MSPFLLLNLSPIVAELRTQLDFQNADRTKYEKKKLNWSPKMRMVLSRSSGILGFGSSDLSPPPIAADPGCQLVTAVTRTDFETARRPNVRKKISQQKL
jgi:hypothetical protein